MSLYVVLCIVLLLRRSGALSSAPVALGGVGRKGDTGLFGRVLSKLRDWVCYVADLQLADLMPSVWTWRLRPLRFPTQGVGWLRELDCSWLDMTER